MKNTVFILGYFSLCGKNIGYNNNLYTSITAHYKLGKGFANEEIHFETMIEGQIRHVNKALKINQQELERIKVRLVHNNRSIKQMLRSEELNAGIKDLLKFNRFLFQKQKEKQVEREQLEDAFKSLLLSEADQENEWMEMEKRMDCFRMTVNKSIPFNENHPFFSDPSFLLELMAEFESREDFESCAALSEFTDSTSSPKIY